MGGRSGLRRILICGRTMFERRRSRVLGVAIVLGTMVCLHFDYGADLSTEHVPTHADGEHSGNDVISPETWEQRAMERVVLETRSRRNRFHGDSISGSNNYNDKGTGAWPIRGAIMLPNHTTVPLDPDYRFDPEGDRDVLVFLHIQKTGGTTFGRHLASNLQLQTPCKCHPDRKKCDCRNSRDQIWTVNRYSTGWRCGLHADWTELTQCVDKMLDKAEGSHRNRRYLYMTILRDPYTRYISEFKHVQRGATWQAARLQCDGRQATLEEVPFCFEGSDWAGVSLDGFMRCPHNLANNRQVRMLANLTLSGCYKNGVLSPELRQNIMLKSAKDNLRQMAFFGLTEFQHETQHLFEKTFGLRFRRSFFQYNHTHASEVEITPRQRRQIISLNSLDFNLYQFAKDLFFRRLRHVLREDAKAWRGDLSYGYLAAAGDKGQDEGMQPARTNQTPRREDYEEGDDDDDADDDDEYNHRIAKIRKTVS